MIIGCSMVVVLMIPLTVTADFSFIHFLEKIIGPWYCDNEKLGVFKISFDVYEQIYYYVIFDMYRGVSYETNEESDIDAACSNYADGSIYCLWK